MRMPEAPHTVRHAFPFTREDGTVLANDEECTCKHLRSAHFDTAAYGHGPCARCGCAKFTWSRFLVAPFVPEPPAQWPTTEDRIERPATRGKRGRP